MRNYILKIVALIILIAASYDLFKTYSSIGSLLSTEYFINVNWSESLIESVLALFPILFFVIVFLKLICSYGLFNNNTWAKQMTIGVLSVDVLLRLLGILNVSFWSSKHHLSQTELNEIMSKSNAIITNGIFPSVVIASTGVICITILMIKNTKEK